MKLTKEDLSILKNFSTINNSLWVDETKFVKTIHPAGNVIGVYELESEFPQKFGIYNLSEFLSILSLFDIEETAIKFTNREILLKYKNNMVKYVLFEKALIRGFENMKSAEKYKSFNKFNCTFNISSEEIKKMKRISNILDIDDIIVGISPKKSMILIDDRDNMLANKYAINIENPKGEGKIIISVERLFMIDDDYECSVITNKLIKFQSKNKKLFYLIGASV